MSADRQLSAHPVSGWRCSSDPSQQSHRPSPITAAATAFGRWPAFWQTKVVPGQAPVDGSSEPASPQGKAVLAWEAVETQGKGSFLPSAQSQVRSLICEMLITCHAGGGGGARDGGRGQAGDVFSLSLRGQV